MPLMTTLLLSIAIVPIGIPALVFSMIYLCTISILSWRRVGGFIGSEFNSVCDEYAWPTLGKAWLITPCNGAGYFFLTNTFGLPFIIAILRLIVFDSFAFLRLLKSSPLLTPSSAFKMALDRHLPEM